MAEALASNLPELTVSEISQAVKRTLESSFERVRVRGEVSKPNYHGSGHLYFSLKDDKAVIDAVCWKGAVGRLKLKIEHGMEVIVTGRISSYPGSSKYQIVLEAVELAGEGALLKMLEERKKRLAAEGLFDEARKRPLPYLPDVIGVITSPTGAVIRDILHRLADRFPRRVLLWPVAVQGEGAAAQVAGAIRGFNDLQPGAKVPRPDLLIVARGGGSLEDLMPFNEEEVVRAAAASAIPLIAAVGHETDVTLIDFAADRRAPTPTAAAEMAVPVRAELLDDLGDHGRRLVRALTRLAEEMAQRLDSWTERLFNSRRAFFASRREHIARLAAGLPTPRQQLAQAELKLKHAVSDLIQSSKAYVTDKRHTFERAATQLRVELIAEPMQRARLRLESLAGLLESYSYEQVLRRGFALVRDAAGHPLATAAAIVPGAHLRIQFIDGDIAATADGDKPRSRFSKPSGDKQGSLL